MFIVFLKSFGHFSSSLVQPLKVGSDKIGGVKSKRRNTGTHPYGYPSRRGPAESVER